MYARSTTIQADTGSIDRGIAHIRDEVMPRLMEMPGCVGLSLLVNRQTGQCIATSSWDSEQSMKASAPQMGAIRDRGAEAFGGQATTVEEWEIAVLHREHQAADGACARVTRLQVDTGRIDQSLDTFRLSVLPKLEEMDGFCSASMLINRETGLCAGSFAFDDDDSIRRSREGATQLREQFAGELSAQIVDVTEFTLALAHLRAPELV